MENLLITKMILVNIFVVPLWFQFWIHAQFLWGVKFKFNLKFMIVLIISYVTMYVIMFLNAEQVFVWLKLEEWATLPWELFFIVFAFSSFFLFVILLLLVNINWDEEESIHIQALVWTLAPLAVYSLYQLFFILLVIYLI